MQCQRFLDLPRSRREMLCQSVNGFGAVAMAALAVDWSSCDNRAEAGSVRTQQPHFAPRVENVIFLYMDGGPSQVDTFDPKPRLAREHGLPIKIKVPVTAERDVGRVMKSPWNFRQYGESGIPIRDLFPHVARHADDLCVVRSMVSQFSEHSAANLLLHSGSARQGRPSMGSWITYGLGSDCKNLPGFVVLSSGMIPPGGLECFRNGQLPASFQASIFKSGKQPIADLQPTAAQAGSRRRMRDMLRTINENAVNRMGHYDELEAAIAKYELAFRMQAAVPDLVDLAGESKTIQHSYGLDADYPPTQIYGRQCLMARRLVERGVRFIEVLCPEVDADRWDQHEHLLEGHAVGVVAPRVVAGDVDRCPQPAAPCDRDA